MIIPYFGLVFRNCVFCQVVVGAGWAEDEVESAGDGGGDGVDAAGAEDFEVAVVGGAEADVVDVTARAAALDDEVGLAFDGKGAYLAEVGGVVEGAGGDGFVEVERLVY